MTDSERLKKVIEDHDMSPNAFGKYVGLKSSQPIYDILKGRNGISKEMADSITAKCPDISRPWLLTGEGSMLKGGEPEDMVQADTVPLLPLSAQGGTLTDFVESVHAIDCERILSPIRGADFAMVIAGDSMAPEYPSGARILMKRINHEAFIEWGKVYVLDTCNGSIIKAVLPTDDPMKIRCVSVNPDFPPFDVYLGDIFNIYRVLLCMSVK